MGRLGSRRELAVSLGSALALGAAIWAFSAWRSSTSPAAPTEDPTPTEGRTPVDSEATPAPDARYVGTAACGECHAAQTDAHRGSHHDRAIEEPSRQTVLAPFQGETFVHDGTTTTFFRKGDDFFVRTLNAKSEDQDFQVEYTFGFFPLQQYLLDVGGGRLQAFTVAWDARSKEDGGQRYFDLYPEEDHTPEDELHWSRPTQNWNFTCADCHTTGLSRGYDAEKDTFSIDYGQLDVGCEACHGPGSNHLAWAKTVDPAQRLPAEEKGLVVSLERAANWQIAPGNTSATPHDAQANRAEVDTCAPCHSRRQQLREGRTPDQPFLDAYTPELLVQGLYHADGQIDDEVYVYGSFLQSRMYHAGVRCSDCHEPHSLKLRRPGNALCGGCHDAQTYDSQNHHHHPTKLSAQASSAGTEGGAQTAPGTACVDCHMPERTYMQVDPRRDHSLRIPRPDLGAAIDAPDACTNCHRDRSPSWAASRIATWSKKTLPPHYGSVFFAARQSDPDALSGLVQLTQSASHPAIVRATALLLLANYPGPESVKALKSQADNPEPLLRLGVTRGSLGLGPRERVEVLRPLIEDRLLSVRTEATRSLVGVPKEAVPPDFRQKLELAFQELLQTERFYADRADAWLRTGLIELGRGKVQEAIDALHAALDRDPRFVPALVNLADLHRMQGNEEESQKLLRRALGAAPENAEAWHALGLSMVRVERMDEATAMLKRATELRPENPRFFYVYAVALADGGDLQGALAALQKGLDHSPHDRSLLQALMSYAKQAGNRQLASEAAIRLAGLGSMLDESH